MELTKEIFQNALQRVILPSDDVVLIYSGIWSFSHRLGCPSKEAPERIMGWIEEVIGPDRTLIFPTYALSFPTTRRYNPGTTPSEVGLLSQTSVQRHGFKRTLQPMYNYAVKGPASDHIFALPCSTSWGEDGLMGWIRRVNGRICVLGVPWHISCSYIHMGEELSQVPYRYPKTFHGIRAVSETQMTACSETMYVRSAAVTPKFDYGTASQAIRGVASFLTSNLPLMPLESALAEDIMRAVLDLLRRNPYQFIVNREPVEAWVCNGKQSEIEELLGNQEGVGQ